MINNSNQTGVLLLLAVVLGATVYSLMFFGSEMEQTNMSASFGQMSKKTSANLLSYTKKAATTVFQTKEIRSDLSGVSLPGYKMKSTYSRDFPQTSNVDFPTTGIEQSNVLNINEAFSSARSNGNYARNNSQSFAFENSNVQYIFNSQNRTKSDINAMLLLDTHATEAALSMQQDLKRATPALAGKTASVSTSLASKTAVKKVGGDPGDPGASLPIGDGIWIMLLFATVYSAKVSNRIFYFLTR